MSLTSECKSLLSRLELVSSVRPVDSAVVAFSGGLDSIISVMLLHHVYKCQQVVIAIGDIGQPQDVIDKAVETARSLPAIKTKIIDLKADFYLDWLPRAIRANSNIRGYPLAAPMIKQILGKRLGELAVSLKFSALAEGSGYTGNDQFRFAGTLALFAPQVRHVAPIRELGLSRIQEISLCKYWEVPYDMALAMGGDDTTSWCRSIASACLRPGDNVDTANLRWVRMRSLKSLVISLDFISGYPTKLNGKPFILQQALDRLNIMIGECGVGYIDIMEDNSLGFKGREIYEAPAASLILYAKQVLESHCLSDIECRNKRLWQEEWTDLVYKGLGYHPLVSALDAAISVVQRDVSGTVTIQIDNGCMRILDVKAKNELAADQFRNLAETTIDPTLISGAVYAHRLRLLTLKNRIVG